VVLGDYLCWGTGVRQGERWLHLLDERLGRYRPTRVVSLCEPGDNAFAPLVKYRVSRALWEAMDVLMSRFESAGFKALPGPTAASISKPDSRGWRRAGDSDMDQP